MIEQLFHLALYVGGAGLFGVVGLACVERLAGSAEPAIRFRHLAAAIGVFAVLVGAELLYHATGG